MIDVIEGGRYRKLTEAEQVAMARRFGAVAVAEYFREREERILAADRDPLRMGFELPHWAELRSWILNRTETYILGANNSAKSYFAGKLVAELMTGRFRWEGMHPGKLKVLMVAQDDNASKQFQQEPVYLHLPVHVRGYNEKVSKPRNADVQVKYTDKNGFTDSNFVIKDPVRRSTAQCWFRTVAQYEKDPNSFEGPAYHLIVIDEGCPLQLLQLLLVRAAKVGGKIVYLHTNVHGISPVAQWVLQGAKHVKTLPMNWDFVSGKADATMEFPELTKCGGGAASTIEYEPHTGALTSVPHGHMPYVMQPLDPNKIIIFIWNHWNPFQPRGKWGGSQNKVQGSEFRVQGLDTTLNAEPRTRNDGRYPAIFDTCVGQPKWKVRVKLFGWIEKLSGAKIANFDPNIHVLPHERIEKLLKEGRLTTYMAADPATAKSYFIAWKGVDENGSQYLMDECPGVWAGEGEWVDANGDEGEGHRTYAAIGSKAYKRIIRERERQHGCEPARRWGDPRAFATQAAAADGGTSLFELFGNDDREGKVTGSGFAVQGQDSELGTQNSELDDLGPMFFEPARIRQTVDLDLERVTSALAWNREQPLTVENQPKLYVSDRCTNIIRAFMNFDGKPDSPFKDPVDAVRYLFCEETPFIDPQAREVIGGGAWGS